MGDTIQRKKRRYQYKPETIINIKKGAAKFLTKCMVEEADKHGVCVILIKKKCEKVFYNNRKKEILEEGTVEIASLEASLDAERQGLCEILYNPFMPSTPDIPHDKKILDYYTNRMLNEYYGRKTLKEIES